MSTIEIQKLWHYLQTLPLSDANKDWLANKLIETKSGKNECKDETDFVLSSPEMLDIINKGDEEIASGNYTVSDPSRLWS